MKQALDNWRYLKGKIILVLIFIVLLPSPGYGASLPHIEILGGHIWSPFLIGPERKTINYYQLSIRERLLTFKQRYSLLLSESYANVTKGSHGYMAGLTLFLRRRFKPIRKIIPYIQIGAGVIYTDIYKDHDQDIIGNNIEFNPQLEAGLEFPLTRSTGLILEFSFQHISNAGLGNRNAGLNGAGFLVGIRFGPP